MGHLQCRPLVLLLKKSDISADSCPGVFCFLFFFQRWNFHSCIQLVLFEYHVPDSVLDTRDIEEQETPVGAGAHWLLTGRCVYTQVLCMFIKVFWKQSLQLEESAEASDGATGPKWDRTAFSPHRCRDGRDGKGEKHNSYVNNTLESLMV